MYRLENYPELLRRLIEDEDAIKIYVELDGEPE
jgi:hypothetical protein